MKVDSARHKLSFELFALLKYVTTHKYINISAKGNRGVQTITQHLFHCWLFRFLPRLFDRYIYSILFLLFFFFSITFCPIHLLPAVVYVLLLQQRKQQQQLPPHSSAICYPWCKSRLFLWHCRKFFRHFLFLDSISHRNVFFYFICCVLLSFPTFDPTAKVIDDEDSTPIESFTQSKNFINLLLSITCVCVAETIWTDKRLCFIWNCFSLQVQIDRFKIYSWPLD